MQEVMKGDITLRFPKTMDQSEADVYFNEEYDIWELKPEVLGTVDIILDGEYVNIKSTERSPITRWRRITGYMAKLDDFNDSKRAEQKARVAHGKI